MLGPGDVVLDCGANVGDICQPLAETGAEVHAFEPDPFAFARLSERVAGYDNVHLHNAAVGPESGTIKLMRAANFDDNPKGGSVKSTVIPGGRNINEAQGDAIDVQLLSLPDFIGDLTRDGRTVAFLKMDIEGAELQLLEDMLARDLFEHIGLTVAETHERKFRDLRPRFRALREAVAAKYPITKVNLDWI
jgi:FkbM family methyltransferase